MKHDIDDIGKRLLHGMPLSIDETRFLYEQATGKPFPKKKRCPTCNAEGKVSKGKFWYSIAKDPFAQTKGQYRDAYRTCPDCQGAGYVAVHEG